MRMRKLLTTGALAVTAMAFGTTQAIAANPHFIGSPTVTDNGSSLTLSGSVAGLGNEDVLVVVTATGTVDIECTNPAGNVAPGQRKIVDLTGSTIIEDPKNGRIWFSVTTAEPETDGAFLNVNGRWVKVCPNRQWTAAVTDVTFTQATVEIYQPAVQARRNLVLEETFEL